MVFAELMIICVLMLINLPLSIGVIYAAIKYRNCEFAKVRGSTQLNTLITVSMITMSFVYAPVVCIYSYITTRNNPCSVKNGDSVDRISGVLLLIHSMAALITVSLICLQTLYFCAKIKIAS